MITPTSRVFLEVGMRTRTQGDCPATPIPASASQSTNNQRRRVLLAFGAGSAGAVAAAVGTLPDAAAVRAAATTQTEMDDGYRDTAHIRDYYRTAKL
jgi:hypothetical protein